jgi:2-methylcitrate dehydratase PrpD
VAITGDVAEFVWRTHAGALAADERAAARRALLDTVGVALAGAREPAVRAVVESVAVGGGVASDAGHTLLGLEGRAGALDAALVNGTAAHALDYDDTQSNVRGHPSAPIVAAALAAAELVGAGGLDLMAAYLIGTEVAGKVGASLGPSHASQGFHSTSTLGVLGAAAASARLLGLAPAQIVAALGVAASSACGLRSNFGTMTKPLHSGNAARAGMFAALVAQRGLTATESALDSPASFTEVFSPGGDGDLAALTAFGRPWEAVDPGIAVKKYPCCNRGHRAADAILAIVDRERLEPADVERVEVRLPAGQADAQGRVGPMTYPRPTTGLQAKFSMPYVIASAIHDGALRIANFTDEQVLRPELQQFLPRVQPISDPDRPAADRASDYVEVVVSRTDGRVLREQVRFPRGDPRGGPPLSWSEVSAKYRDCAGRVLSGYQIERSLAIFADLDALGDVRDLTAELSPGPW